MVFQAERRHTPRPAAGSNMKLWKDLSGGPSEQTAEWGGHWGSLRGKYALGDTRPGVEILCAVKDLDFLFRAEGEKKKEEVKSKRATGTMELFSRALQCRLIDRRPSRPHLPGTLSYR